MTDRNENRTGYKKTKVGWIPKDWGVTGLKDVCSKPVSGFSLKGAERPARLGEYGVLKLSCIQNGRFIPTENKVVKRQAVSKLRTPVRKDTLLVSRSNTDELVGAVCFVDRDFPHLFLSDLIWEVSNFNNSILNIRWLTYLLCSDYYRARIVAIANGTSGSMKKITKPSFLGLSIPIPLVSEQKKSPKYFPPGTELSNSYASLLMLNGALKMPSCSNCLPAKNVCRALKNRKTEILTVFLTCLPIGNARRSGKLPRNVLNEIRNKIN